MQSEKAFGSMQRSWSDRGAFGKGIWVMQRSWSDRRAFRKSIWVNAEELK
ncbi:hypothetical protein [Bacillus sp. OK048]|nr:hypothetical protein [Bacillus sp. OK048]